MNTCPYCKQKLNDSQYCQSCRIQLSYAKEAKKQPKNTKTQSSKQWPLKKIIPLGIVGFILILLIILFLLLRNYNSPEAQAQILVNAIENNDNSRVSTILSSKDNKVGTKEAATYIQYIKNEIGMKTFDQKVEDTVKNLDQKTSVASYVKTNDNQNVLRISKNGRRYLFFSNLGFQAPTKQAEVKPDERATFEYKVDGSTKKIVADKGQAVSLGNFIPGTYAIDAKKTTERGTYNGTLKFDTTASKNKVMKVTEDFEEAAVKPNLKNTEGLDEDSLKVVINDESLDYSSGKTYQPFPFDQDLKVYATGQTHGKTFKTKEQVISKNDIQSTNNVQLTFDKAKIDAFNEEEEKTIFSKVGDFVKEYVSSLNSATENQDFDLVSKYLGDNAPVKSSLQQQVEQQQTTKYINTEVTDVQQDDQLYYINAENETEDNIIKNTQYVIQGNDDGEQLKIVNYANQ